MKRCIFLINFIFVFALNSCDSDDESFVLTDYNCETLSEGLLSYNIDKVKSVFEIISADLTPKDDVDDLFGHKENFTTLVARLNTCELINSELICYACIKTYPPQSELLIEIDSSGQFVNRVVDILTPGDSLISFIGIHK